MLLDSVLMHNLNGCRSKIWTFVHIFFPVFLSLSLAQLFEIFNHITNRWPIESRCRCSFHLVKYVKSWANLQWVAYSIVAHAMNSDHSLTLLNSIVLTETFQFTYSKFPYIFYSPFGISLHIFVMSCRCRSRWHYVDYSGPSYVTCIFICNCRDPNNHFQCNLSESPAKRLTFVLSFWCYRTCVSRATN